MRKFFIKSFIFCSILILISVLADLSLPSKNLRASKTDYMASIIDKHKRLEQFDGNRLLLVGGSNLTFGVNSELIEKEFNVNVVNLSLHAGLGFDFILNEAISVVKKNDVLLLSVEYYLYADSAEPDIDLIYHTQNLFPKSKEFYQINLKDRLLIYLKNLRKRLQVQKSSVHPVYNRKAFNKYGDEIGHLTQSPPKDLADRWKMPKLLRIDNRVELLNKLYLTCNATGAKLYILYPNYPASEFSKNKDVIYDLRQQLNRNISYIKIINEPESFVYDDSLFFDTVFHLNADGREMRTQKLIEILKSKVYTL